jgi:hypothetical protein
MFQTEFAEKIKAHILISIPLFSENRVGYGIRRKNEVVSEKQQNDNIIRRLRDAI